MNLRRKLMLLMFAGFCIPASVQAGWTLIGHHGLYRTVLIDPADKQNVQVYWDALRKICRGKYCNLMFVSDEKMLPGPGERLNDGHIKDALLIYTTNKGFSWNCQLRPDADNCFEWK